MKSTVGVSEVLYMYLAYELKIENPAFVAKGRRCIRANWEGARWMARCVYITALCFSTRGLDRD